MVKKNLNLRKKNKKPDYTKVKLFFIKTRKKNSKYKLKLLKNTKVYSISYVLLLKLINYKHLYKIHFIIKFQIKTSLNLKLFYQVKKILYIKKYIKIIQKFEKLYLFFKSVLLIELILK